MTLRPMPGLVVKTHLVGEDTTAVVVTGELDFATRDALVEALMAIEELGTGGLVLDLRHLSFIGDPQRVRATPHLGRRAPSCRTAGWFDRQT